MSGTFCDISDTVSMQPMISGQSMHKGVGPMCGRGIGSSHLWQPRIRLNRVNKLDQVHTQLLVE